MSNAKALAVAPDKSLFTPEDLEILRRTKFKGFTNDEIQYAAKMCALLNLNPMLNQIHFVKRVDRKTGNASIAAQVGIDGLRLTAQRAGGYAGSDAAVFEYDEKDKKKQYPLKATVTVYKVIEGVRCPSTAEARWDEFYPGDGPHGFMWNKMPHVMLGKCAEGQALRKAFPAELSNVYAEEELHQAKDFDPSRITPGQPGEKDGVADDCCRKGECYRVPSHLDYRIAGKSLHRCDHAILRDVVAKIEKKYADLRKPIPEKAKAFIAEVERLLIAHETAPESFDEWEGGHLT